MFKQLFNQLLLGQTESLGRLRQLLRVLVVGVSLCFVGASYSLWSMQANLTAQITSVRSMKSQTRQMSDTLHTKTEQVAAASGLKMTDPMCKGSMELTSEISSLAHAAGVHVGAFHFMPQASASVAPAANPPQAASATGGAADPGVQKAPAPAHNSRWTQATFDYEFTGTFHALSALMHDMATMPRIIEINTVELEGLQPSSTKDSVITRLRLSGILYGLPETGTHE